MRTYGLLTLAAQVFLDSSSTDGSSLRMASASATPIGKHAFIENLIEQMTVPEMVVQLHQTFADEVVGMYSHNELYDEALQPAPGAGIGVIHDWYTLNRSQFNDLQRLNLEKSRLKIPMMHMGECLHGVGSFKQSMFPQALAMAASWDTNITHNVGRAIGTEARAIGIHACFAPVLDICQDPRWGRCQEDWGEDHILTSHMGVAFASGLSKNSSWDEPDAVVPVMKHFAAHGSPQSGLNTAPFMGHGIRQVLQQLLVPFKAVVDLAGVRGVMMAYSELDDVPSMVNPLLYDSLENWGYDGFVIADDTALRQLETAHHVANSPADAIEQWFNAGGMIQFYDYPLSEYLNVTVDLVRNGSVSMSTLQNKMRHILGVKYDLGLFKDPYIPEDIDAEEITDTHVPLALDAAHKSIVLLENRNATLPLRLTDAASIALIGPYGDTLNFGDYSGQYGAYPVEHGTTIRQSILEKIQHANSSSRLVGSWGANDWLYNAQYPIPSYLQRAQNGSQGGLSATYYADVNFKEPLVHKIESPVRDWGLYPPPGLPSNNFSAVWEGEIVSPVDTATDGWLGVAIEPNTTAKVYLDDQLHTDVPLTTSGNVLSNAPGYQYGLLNSTMPPPGSAAFAFQPGRTYHIRVEYQAWNLAPKEANVNSLNSQVILFWNLVDRVSPVEKAVAVARDADVIVLALGASWSSDGENVDRATLDLPTNQSALADAIFALDKPVVLVLAGGRPFAVPQYYDRSAAVLNVYFGGQAAGQAIADVLFGDFNPGGRLPVTIPRHVGQLPVYYNFKPTAHAASYVDVDSTPMYSFGFGLSYSNFTIHGFQATVVNGLNHDQADAFHANDTIVFATNITNSGMYAGSYVAQVYLLSRVSQITQPLRQLVAFQRVYLGPGETQEVRMELDVSRYLQMLNRRYEWEVEKGAYTFALAENGGMTADTNRNVTLHCA